jgi:hypothetical protein
MKGNGGEDAYSEMSIQPIRLGFPKKNDGCGENDRRGGHI